jgi:hypothetical protein
VLRSLRIGNVRLVYLLSTLLLAFRPTQYLAGKGFSASCGEGFKQPCAGSDT